MSTLPYPNAQVIFQQQYESVRRDEVVGVLLALFLGGFGIHQFYLGRTGLGIFYLCFCWTGIPSIIAFFECFFMPGRVREYNAFQAANIAASLGIPVPGYVGYPGWPAPGSATGSASGYTGAYAPASAAPASGQPAGLAFQPAGAALTACPNCNNPNAPGARFCAACGTQLA
jgi:TM2 domain-containing membrane protein YozV